MQGKRSAIVRMRDNAVRFETTFVAGMTALFSIATKVKVARKKRGVCQSDGGMADDWPRMLFTSSGLRLLQCTFMVFLLAFASSAMACIYQGGTTPCPLDCIEDGGETVCIKPVPAPTPGQDWIPTDAGKWRYGNSWYPGTDYDYGTWCLAAGATIGVIPPDTFISCIGLPYGYLGFGAGYFVEGLVKPAARAFANYGWCPHSSETDSGWGKENFPNAFQYQDRTKTKRVSGIEVTSYREMIFSGGSPKKPDGTCDTANARDINISAVKYRDAVCPTGYDRREYPRIDEYNLVVKCALRTQETCESTVGNPIAMALGSKLQTETDYSLQGSALLLRRTYRSHGFFSPDAANNTQPHNFGQFWRHHYQRLIHRVTATAAISAIAERHDGTIERFDANGNQIEHFGKSRSKLSPTPAGWLYTGANDEQEVYDSAGQLQSIASRGGATITLTYSDAATPSSTAPFPGLLVKATDNFGRSLLFRYNASGLVASVTEPGGGVFSYTYTAESNIDAVSMPDSKVRNYAYSSEPGEAVNTGGSVVRNMLTGIYDENGARFATYKYNGTRAISTEHAGGVSKYSVQYGSNVAIATDPLGTQRTYFFSTILGVAKTTSVSQPCPTCGSGNAQAITYDSNGNAASKTDFNNNKTCYTYDLTRNLETARIEGLASSADCTASFAAANLPAPIRKTTTTWHPTYRLPATITEPTALGTKTTTNTYDANGNLTQRSITVPNIAGATPATVTRTWSWNNYDAYGRYGTMTDPRGKVTTYTYYPNTAAQNAALANSRGMLASITNALGHTTTFNAYNAHGQALSITDANGLTTSMVYDARMRLTSRSVANGTTTETTTYDYDGVGQLKKVTLPDTSFITYTYDDAHRLTKIADSQGNSITYTLDNMGNRIGEQASDPAGALARKRTREIDALNRLKFDQGGTHTTTTPQQTEFTYDANGNQKTLKDANANTTTSNYDALNRLIEVIDPVNGTANPTKYDYDAQDNLSKVTDAKGLATTYTYTGFGELATQTSPDTGLTSFTYDAAGNLATKTDARGIKATYGYDDLNRVTSTVYTNTTAVPPNPAVLNTTLETVTYAYDGCSNGKGRLCSITDKTGVTAYAYDLNDRIVSKSQTVAGLTQTVSYRYNAAGQMDQMTTPSGQLVGYGYANNRIVSVTLNGATVLSGVDYEPFGPVAEWTWGNSPAGGTANKHQRRFDLDGRIDLLQPAAAQPVRKIGYDSASRITSLEQLVSGSTFAATGNATSDPAASFSYGYDNLDRLTNVSPQAGNPAPAQAYTYDAIGNRLTQTAATATTTYNYPTPATSHRLQSLTGATSKVYTYDNIGNLINDGVNAWIYAADNRPKQVTTPGAGVVLFQINALGQRVAKGDLGVVTPRTCPVAGGTTTPPPAASTGGTRFVYDEAGRLIGEYDGAGFLKAEHLWLNDLPIATLKPNGLINTNNGATVPAVDVYYVHADHLGTPRAITRASDNALAWKWDNTEPFGNNPPNQNPAALGTFTYNLRMPGQYFDQETGTFYNYFRDYEPSTGRYVQSDPIGLRGGMNTYAYAFGRPLNWSDFFGLDVNVCFYADAAAGFGHIGLGPAGSSGTSGFYPGGANGMGQVIPDNQKEKTCTVLKADPSQDECVEKCKQERTEKPGPYNVLTRQCTGFVRDCLTQCKIVKKPYPGPLPDELFRSIGGPLPRPTRNDVNGG
jgi:RHS repeat-associated protein